MSDHEDIAVTSGPQVMEAKFKQFVRHQNALWAMRSMLLAAAILGAAAVMPGQIWLGFLWLVPAVSFGAMMAFRSSARKKFLPATE